MTTRFVEFVHAKVLFSRAAYEYLTYEIFAHERGPGSKFRFRSVEAGGRRRTFTNDLMVFVYVLKNHNNSFVGVVGWEGEGGPNFRN